jgi:hypothetical protein
LIGVNGSKRYKIAEYINLGMAQFSHKSRRTEG